MSSIPRSAKWLLLLVLLGCVVAGLLLLRRQPPAGAPPAVLYGLRAGTIALALGGWFLSQSLIGSRTLGSGAIEDGVHELSAPLHRALLAHPHAANATLIVSSGFIDLFGLFVIGLSLLGPTMRPFVALLIVFGMRQICQAVCAIPAPRDMIWRDPGFPSLLVTYGVASDFFFSGHTAIAVLGAVELSRVAPPWVGVAAGIVAFLEASTVLVLRAHYTMDIFGAVLAALAAVGISDWLFAL